jgi:hypothetical protein
VDVAPKQKTTPRQKIAQPFRLLGSTGGERRNAFAALERLMQSEGVSWSDIGNAVERDEDKYTEAEMLEFTQAKREEGVEAGIKIGLARAGNGSSNGGGLTLPPAAEMAEYCYARLGRLRNDNERDVVSKARERQGKRLSPGEFGYLTSIYLQTTGRRT